MPLRWAGFLALAAAGLLAGSAYARAGKRELEELAALSGAFSYMETQIAALRTPLPALIEQLAGREDGLFREANARLAAGLPLSQALSCLCARFADKQVTSLVRDLFDSLGACDAVQAVSILRTAQAALAGIIGEKTRRFHEKAPLARRLALAAALTLAVLLL